jgi:hypothetical protein
MSTPLPPESALPPSHGHWGLGHRAAARHALGGRQRQGWDFAEVVIVVEQRYVRVRHRLGCVAMATG